MGTVHNFSPPTPAGRPRDLELPPEPPADSRQGRLKQIYGTNKEALLQALSASGITHILLCFNGNDGFREMDCFEARAGAVAIDQPLALVEIAHLPPDSDDPVSMRVALPQAVRLLTFGLLDQVHDGWHRDYGAYGELTIDVAAGHIGLAYNERRMTSDYSEHRF